MSIRNPQSVIRNQHSTSPRKVIVLVGPTASGKTAISLELAKLVNAEIISADSRQIYKHLDIGTAKPSAEQLSIVKHHFVGELLPNQEFNAGEFGEKGRQVIEDIFLRNKTPLVVGGSGLYIHSLIDGFFEGPSADKEYREKLQQRIARGELSQLTVELKRVDPVSADRIDPTKPRRVMRALEVFHITGIPLSQLQQESKIEINFASKLFGLGWERSALYERINRRCEAMIENGLLDEVEELERMGFDSSLNALNTVGYAEAFAYRQGEISREEMMRLFKQNTRRYAKRQLTWFRKDERVQWIQMREGFDASEIANAIVRNF